MSESGAGAGRELAEEARASAAELRQRAERRVEEQKRSAGEEVRGIVNALRAAADKLDEQEQHGVARYAHEAADVVERFGDTIQHKSISDILTDVERASREHPAVVAGIAAVVGFAGTRFLRSTEHREEPETREPVTPELPLGVPEGE